MSAKGNERIELEAQPLNSGSVKVEVLTGSNGSNPITITKEKALPLGLTKEELMKYANDPFWIKLRRTLFALFWLIWLSMFVGAFLIIHYFPPCSASSKLRWFQRGTCSQFDSKLFGNNLQTIATKMPTYMNAFEFDNLILPSLFQMDNEDNVLDFSKLHSTWGEMADFDHLLETLQVPQKVNILIDLKLGTTSMNHPWYTEFLSGDPDRADFYVVLPKDATLEGSVYKSLGVSTSGPKSRPLQLLVKAGRPMLNLNNERVLAAIGASLRVWTRKGVSGFRLLDAPYLLPHPDDSKRYVIDLNQNAELIARITAMIKSLKSDAILVVQLQSDYKSATDQSKFYGTDELPIADSVVSSAISDLSLSDGAQLLKVLNDTIKAKPVWNPGAAVQGPWTGWLIESAELPSNRPESRCLRNVLGHLLPRGSPIAHIDSSLLVHSASQDFFDVLNDLLRNSSSVKSSNVRMFKELHQLRRDHVDTIMFGSIDFPHVDSKVFSMARYSADTKEGFLLVANLGAQEHNLPILSESYLPEVAHVQLTCASHRHTDQQVSLIQKMRLIPNEVLLLRFQLPI
jgi:hypothetical protein